MSPTPTQEHRGAPTGLGSELLTVVARLNRLATQRTHAIELEMGALLDGTGAAVPLPW